MEMLYLWYQHDLFSRNVLKKKYLKEKKKDFKRKTLSLDMLTSGEAKTTTTTKLSVTSKISRYDTFP